MDVVVGDVAGADGPQVRHVHDRGEHAVGAADRAEQEGMAFQVELLRIGQGGHRGDCENRPANQESQIAMTSAVVWRRASSTTCRSQAISWASGNASSTGPAPKKWSP